MGNFDAGKWRTALAAFLVGVVIPCAALATEAAEEFVKGLQGRGMHDLALEYLEQLKSSPLADDATRQKVPYLRGVALVEQSRQSADPTVRAKLLDQARQELERFAEANPHSIQNAEAQLQLATVQLSRGEELVAQIVQMPNDATYGAQRKKLERDARVLFADARDTFGRAEAIYSAELEKLPPATDEEARSEGGTTKRQKYRGRVAQLRFMIAKSQFEEAKSYPHEADEFKKLNGTAAKELSSIYDEFSGTLPGLYARLYEGRCYQSVGSYQEALGCFEEIIGKEIPLPEFRKLAADAIQRKVEVLISQDKTNEAITAAKDCLKIAHKDEEKQPEWVRVRFVLAEALSKKSQSAKEDSPEKRRLQTEAREAYRAVARMPGEYQAAARTAALVTGDSKKTEGKTEDPKNFEAAYELGKDALSTYNSAKLALPSAERNNPSAVPELKSQMESGKEDARRYFRLATTMVADDTDPKMLNEVRYFLCWLYWESQDYYRAAVLGEFIARRYPDHPAASSSAKIAMASLEQLYGQARAAKGGKDSGEFEAAQMSQLAEFIARRWPGTSDADAAFGVMVNDAIRNGKIEDAEKLLAKASEQSRPRLALQLGNAMWLRYLDLSQPGQKSAGDTAALDKLKAASMTHLRNGLDVLKKDTPVSDPVVFGALYLAQAQLSDGKFAEAIASLEDKQIGPLTLVTSDNSAASRPPYQVEAYKAALRAYVSVTPPQEKKALATMQLLERVVQQNLDASKATDQLNRIYIGLGVSLQKQMQELHEAGNDEDAKRVAAAFSKFVERIGNQKDANWPTRMWIAQASFAIAKQELPVSELKEGTPTQLSPSAKMSFTKARDSYQQLLKEAAGNPQVAPNKGSVLGAKIQLGECYRALGDYQKALDTFSEVLFEKETSLEMQRTAALTFQERGQRDDPKWFEQAIFGGYKMKDGKNRVWGWQRISTVSQHMSRSDKSFKDPFYEARLNIARCRYMNALKQKGDARKQELVKAKESIQSTSQLYPDLGGEKWKPKFDELMKNVQKEEATPAENAK